MHIPCKSLLWLIVAIIAVLSPGYYDTLLAQGETDPAESDTDNSCTPIINQLASAIDSCDLLDGNSACYGNSPAVATPLDIDFDAPGERQPIGSLQTIETNPEAGAVLMMLYLQGETNPVTVILFGGSTLTPQVGRNVFLLRGSVGSEVCEQSPPGMVVSTESGESGSLTVNGVRIELASAAYIALTDTGTMVIANLDGEVAVTIGGERQEIPEGFQSVILQIDIGQPAFAGPPVPSPLFGSLVGQFLANNAEGLRQVSITDEPSPEIEACGGTIMLGQTITARISTPGEECLYTFCSLEGRSVSINVDRVDVTMDPWVGLRAPDGTLLKFNNDISEQNLNSRICNSTLPVVGCYTIAVRSLDEGIGVFRLSLGQQVACAQPVPRCEVVATALNQREGPSLDAPIIRTLPQGTELRPIEGSADGQWVNALVAGTNLGGWVNTNIQLLACEDAIPEPLVEPTAGAASIVPEEDDETEPTVTPEPTKEGTFPPP